jgi:hypothetical protein
MPTIWKYNLSLVDEQVIEIPASASNLTLQMQGGGPRLWALVDPTAPTVKRTIRMFGTGHPVPDDIMAYLGTVQDGPFVWHFFQDFKYQESYDAHD